MKISNCWIIQFFCDVAVALHQESYTFVQRCQYVSSTNLTDLMSVKWDVQVYSSFVRSGTTRFKFSCLRSSLSSALYVVCSIVWLSLGKTMVLILCGPYQLPVFLKYSVCLKLLVQHSTYVNVRHFAAPTCHVEEWGQSSAFHGWEKRSYNWLTASEQK